MDRKIKRTWVKALRSGKYKQGKGELRSPDETKHCCLGVLIACQGATEADWEDLKQEEGTFTTNTVPKKFMAGMSLPTRDELAAMNDGMTYCGKPTDFHTFAQLADHIEKTL